MRWCLCWAKLHEQLGRVSLLRFQAEDLLLWATPWLQRWLPLFWLRVLGVLLSVLGFPFVPAGWRERERCEVQRTVWTAWRIPGVFCFECMRTLSMGNLSHHLCPKSISISFSNSVKSKSGQNTWATVSLCHCVTCQSGRGYYVGRTIYYSDPRETLYIGNREMSDKSRNEL